MPSVVLAVLLMCISSAMNLVRFLSATGDARYYGSPASSLFFDAIDVAALLLLAGGIRAIAARLTGAQRTGAKVAEITLWCRAVLVISVAGTIFVMRDSRPDTHEAVWLVRTWLSFALNFGTAAGLVVAARAWRHPVGIALVAIVTVRMLPPLSKALGKALGESGEPLWILMFVGSIACVALLANKANRDATATAPESPRPGFALSALALRMRLGGMALAMSAGLMAGLSRSMGALKFSLMLTPVIALVTSLIFGLGLLRAVRANLDTTERWMLLAGAACTFWVLGLSAAQLPYVYSLYYGGDGLHDAAKYATALIVPSAVVSLLGVLLPLLGVARYLRQRGFEDLAKRATLAATLYTAAMLAALLLTNYVLGSQRSAAGFAFVGIAAAVLGLIATVKAQGAFTAAEESADTMAFPTARVVDP